MKRVVGKNWTWFAEYLCAWGDWEASTPPGRRIQVGMGVSVGGEPRGEKVSITGHGKFVTIGVGSIHVRIHDDGPPCEVDVTQKTCKPIPLPGCDFIAKEVEVLSVGGETTMMRAPHVDYTHLNEHDAEVAERFNAAIMELIAVFRRLHNRQ